MKTNSESSAAENETANAVTNESGEQGMSSGAAMLIERMKTNPDDFKFSGKFFRVVDSIHEPEQRWISSRDMRALRAAYELHIRESEFAAWVVETIFSPAHIPEQKILTGTIIRSSASNVYDTDVGTQPLKFHATGRYDVGSS